jgi:hypothetical protein
MEVLVDNETLMVDGTEFGHPDSSALLSWSLRRSFDRRLAQVGTPNGGSHASIIAFDLRIDLLDDTISLELTRGMEIDITGYEPIQGPPVPLRAKIARIIRARVLDHAFSLPK